MDEFVSGWRGGALGGGGRLGEEVADDVEVALEKVAGGVEVAGVGRRWRRGEEADGVEVAVEVEERKEGRGSREKGRRKEGRRREKREREREEGRRRNERGKGEGGCRRDSNSNPALQFCGAYVDMRHRIVFSIFLILQ